MTRFFFTALASVPLVLGSLPAAAFAPAGFYRGTLGGDAVSVCFGDTSTAYLETDPTTMVLDPIPSRPGVWLVTDEIYPRDPEENDPERDEFWQLAPADGSGAGNLAGRRRAPEHPDQPIALAFVAADCVPSYEQHRLGRPRETLRTEASNGIELVVTVHPATRVESVTLLSGLPEAAMATINAALATAAAELDTGFIECRDWEAAVRAQFISRLWLIFEVSSSGYCGGPHPNEDSSILSFAGATGEAIGFDTWIDPRYRDGTALGGELRAAVRRRITEDTEDDTCANHRDELSWGWQLPMWLAGDGVEFKVEEIDRAFLFCESDHALTFGEIRPFIAPESLERYNLFAAEAARLGDHCCDER